MHLNINLKKKYHELVLQFPYHLHKYTFDQGQNVGEQM